MSNGITFTKEEAAYIDKHLNGIVFKWPNKIVSHILSEASKNGVKNVYMNTSKTLKAGGINDDKNDFFYERLPVMLNFTKAKVNLRGKSEEMWKFNTEVVAVKNETSATPETTEVKTNKKRGRKSKMKDSIKLEDIPENRRGIFISVAGRKEVYDSDDIKKILDILQKKSECKKEEISAKFYYDWNSKTYSGDQNFKSGVTEKAVLLKMHTEFQNYINNDNILSKFWSYILSYSGHFGNDVIGFALVSKLNATTWVINEVQTDSISHYLSLRSKALGWNSDYEKTKGITWEVLKDMLVTNNKNNWIIEIEKNEKMKEDFMNNPELVSRLPEKVDMSGEFQKYIS